MSFFIGSDGKLKLGNPTDKSDGQSDDSVADIAKLARAEGKPTYFYDLDHIEGRYRAYAQALSGVNASIHYAMKANSHAGILTRLGRLGAGADTVSFGEIKLAIEAGIPASRIIFSGVAKTARELEEAMRLGIKQINVESPQELDRIAKIASDKSLKADVAFRMNPDVDAKTHPYITTGFRENKFGMDESFLPELLSILNKSKENVRLRGLTLHIGSLLFDLNALREAMEKTAIHYNELIGKGFDLDRFDIGGGLGIKYDTSDETEELDLLKQYGEMVTEVVKTKLKKSSTGSIEVLAEPGRMIVARAGILVGEVQYIKIAPTKTFAILDTGMHHLLRPALYQAKHRVLAVEPSHENESSYDIVGPICESSDVLARNVQLNALQQGDLIAIADAGAYGFAMASRYNAHDWPAEIAISNGHVLEASSSWS